MRELDGLIIAGSCFILPPCSSFGRWQPSTPATRRFLRSWLYGIKPVIIAIVAQAVGLESCQGYSHYCGRGSGDCCLFLSVDELLLLLLAGCGVMLVKNLWRTRSGTSGAMLYLFLEFWRMSVAPCCQAPATWLNVFLFFLKIGSVLYGSGYVLLALQGVGGTKPVAHPSNFWMQLPLVSSRLVLCLPQRPSLAIC